MRCSYEAITGMNSGSRDSCTDERHALTLTHSLAYLVTRFDSGVLSPLTPSIHAYETREGEEQTRREKQIDPECTRRNAPIHGACDGREVWQCSDERSARWVSRRGIWLEERLRREGSSSLWALGEERARLGPACRWECAHRELIHEPRQEAAYAVASWSCILCNGWTGCS